MEKRLTENQVLVKANESKEKDTVVVQLADSLKARVEKLDRYSAKVEESYKEIESQSKGDDFRYYSEDDIRWHLQHDPNMVAESGLMLADIQKAYDNARIDTKVILAEVWNQCNKNREALGLTSAEDRKNWVQANGRYVVALRQEVQWKYQLARMQIIYDKYQDIFTGIRKLATIIQTSNEIQTSNDKWGGSNDNQ